MWFLLDWAVNWLPACCSILFSIRFIDISFQQPNTLPLQFHPLLVTFLFWRPDFAASSGEGHGTFFLWRLARSVHLSGFEFIVEKQRPTVRRHGKKKKIPDSTRSMTPGIHASSDLGGHVYSAHGSCPSPQCLHLSIWLLLLLLSKKVV